MSTKIARSFIRFHTDDETRDAVLADLREQFPTVTFTPSDEPGLYGIDCEALIPARASVRDFDYRMNRAGGAA